MIEGIYARLAENIEKEPDVDSFITFNEKLPPLLIRQEWFDLKNIILTERLDKQHKTIFLTGTAGRGKLHLFST
jgi:DNA replication protein DnaC